MSDYESASEREEEEDRNSDSGLQSESESEKGSRYGTTEGVVTFVGGPGEEEEEEEVDDGSSAVSFEDDAEGEQEDAEEEEEGKEVDTSSEYSAELGQSRVMKGKESAYVAQEDDEEEEEEDESFFQKFDRDVVHKYVTQHHPECVVHNFEEVRLLAQVTRNAEGTIIDALHRTVPHLTKYERARVLGQRAKQIETGSKPLVAVSENILESHLIAEMELQQKKIPFIIRRPLPNGAFEYWHLADLENIDF